jgi:hypothetical protein
MVDRSWLENCLEVIYNEVVHVVIVLNTKLVKDLTELVLRWTIDRRRFGKRLNDFEFALGLLVICKPLSRVETSSAYVALKLRQNIV